VVAQLERMIYVDDSGNPRSGLVVFGWVEFAPNAWGRVVETWLDCRRAIWRSHTIPISLELHTTDLVHGRSRLAQRVPDRYVHDGAPYLKDLGRDVAQICLNTIRSVEGLRIGSVYRQATDTDTASAKQQVYAALVGRWEEELAASDTLGMVIMDGDGTDQSYRQAHRSLPLRERRLIEDTLFLDSRASLIMQMADLVAWCANTTLDPVPQNAFAHNWYAEYLAERDPVREPQLI
jgi:hypothetical protein